MNHSSLHAEPARAPCRRHPRGSSSSSDRAAWHAPYKALAPQTRTFPAPGLWQGSFRTQDSAKQQQTGLRHRPRSPGAAEGTATRAARCPGHAPDCAPRAGAFLMTMCNQDSQPRCLPGAGSSGIFPPSPDLPQCRVAPKTTRSPGSVQCCCSLPGQVTSTPRKRRPAWFVLLHLDSVADTSPPLPVSRNKSALTHRRVFVAKLLQKTPHTPRARDQTADQKLSHKARRVCLDLTYLLRSPGPRGIARGPSRGC